MINPLSPVGVFDSGVGGLTVVRAIKKLMPEQRIIYFGDTRHLPYGDKDADLICGYAKRIASFLLSAQCKAIVVACHSACSTALEDLRETIPKPIGIFDVLTPTVELLHKKKYRKIGLIGTRATIGSELYLKLIKKNYPNLEIAQLATPLLAPMVEEGFGKDKVSSALINHYLSHKVFKDIEAMILACTHYCLLEEEIKEFYNGKIDIIESSHFLAEKLFKNLSEQNLLPNQRKEEDLFYVSSKSNLFERQAKSFFGERIYLQLLQL